MSANGRRQHENGDRRRGPNTPAAAAADPEAPPGGWGARGAPPGWQETDQLVTTAIEQRDAAALQKGLKAFSKMLSSGPQEDMEEEESAGVVGGVYAKGAAPSAKAGPGAKEPRLKPLPRGLLSRYVWTVCCDAWDTDLLKVLLQCWRLDVHGSWSLLTSKGPVPPRPPRYGTTPVQYNSAKAGHECSLLHTLVQRCVERKPDDPRMAVRMALAITGSRPEAVLDRDPQDRLPLAVALKGAAPQQLVSAVAPLTHVKSREAREYQEDVVDAAEQEGKLSLDYRREVIGPLNKQIERQHDKEEREEDESTIMSTGRKSSSRIEGYTSGGVHGSGTSKGRGGGRAGGGGGGGGGRGAGAAKMQSVVGSSASTYLLVQSLPEELQSLMLDMHGVPGAADASAF